MENLPSLSGKNPDGTVATFRYDRFSRVTIRVKDEEGTLIDVMGPFWTASEALAALVLEYPNTYFRGEK